MISQINQLIGTKLSLLFSATDYNLHLNDFKNTPKSKLQDAEILVEMMMRKELIRLHPDRELTYELTDFGKQICKNGGWLLHLEKRKTFKKENKKQKNALTQPLPFWRQFSKSVQRFFKT